MSNSIHFGSHYKVRFENPVTQAKSGPGKERSEIIEDFLWKGNAKKNIPGISLDLGDNQKATPTVMGTNLGDKGIDFFISRVSASFGKLMLKAYGSANEIDLVGWDKFDPQVEKQLDTLKKQLPGHPFTVEKVASGFDFTYDPKRYNFNDYIHSNLSTTVAKVGHQYLNKYRPEFIESLKSI